MKKEIIISGFGGQGVLSMGKILAYSGLMEVRRHRCRPEELPTVLVADNILKFQIKTAVSILRLQFQFIE